MLVEFSLGLLFLLMVSLQHHATWELSLADWTPLIKFNHFTMLVSRYPVPLGVNGLYQCQRCPIPGVPSWTIVDQRSLLLRRDSVEARNAPRKLSGTSHAEAISAARLFVSIPAYGEWAAVYLSIPCTMIALWMMQNQNQNLLLCLDQTCIFTPCCSR